MFVVISLDFMRAQEHHQAKSEGWLQEMLSQPGTQKTRALLTKEEGFRKTVTQQPSVVQCPQESHHLTDGSWCADVPNMTGSYHNRSGTRRHGGRSETPGRWRSSWPRMNRRCRCCGPTVGRSLSSLSTAWCPFLTYRKSYIMMSAGVSFYCRSYR